MGSRVAEQRDADWVDRENGGAAAVPRNYDPPASKEFREGQGSWFHGGYHLSTTIATPAAFAPLPFAVASLGWEAGVIVLVMGTMVTCYSSFLLASLWDYDQSGKRVVSYGALAHKIFGYTGYWSVIFFQQIASIGNNITIQIVAGISMKAIYKTYHPNGSMTLQDFIIIFGALELILSQFPDIHSLRQLNLLCTICTVGFAVTALALSINNGKDLRNQKVPIKYGLGGIGKADKLFGIFNALGTIAFSFGDAMLPEIQSTLREPPRRNMYKGIGLAYSTIAVTYWLVAFVGYWAFGQDVNVFLVNSFTHPNWAITLTYIFAVFQVAGCYQIYCRPTYEYVEFKFLDHRRGLFAPHNIIRRLLITGTYIVIITLVACALPFFGDFVALCGAVGFTPLDFILPLIAYTVVRRAKNPLFLVLNIVIVSLYTLVAFLGSIGAIRSIHNNVSTYSLFSNL